MTTVSDLAGLAACSRDWDDLALEAEGGLPTLSSGWVAALVEHRLPADCTWRALLAWSDDRLVGVLPLLVRSGRLGTTLVAPDDPQTAVLSWHPLLAPGVEGPALAALHAALPRHRMTTFARMRTDTALPALAGVTVFEGADLPGSVVSTRGSLSDLESRLGSNFTRNLSKAGRRASRQGAEYRFVTGEAAADPALLQAFLAMEGSGWKGAEGTAIVGQPSLVAFYTSLCRRMAERGWLEWHVLDLEGRPAAMHLAVRFGRAVVLPRIAHDEQHGRLGPGNLLFRALLERACADEGVDEVDCLTDMPWHDNWAMDERLRRDLVLVPRRPVPLVLGALGTGLPARLRTAAKGSPRVVRAVERLRALRS